MQCANLTDDALWSEITENTNAMSLLFDEHRLMDTSIDMDDRDRREDLVRSHLVTVIKLMREYHGYTTELRRRHPMG